MKKTENGKEIKIQCDECKHSWKPTNKMLLENRQSEEITEVYYVCPKCKKKFHVAYKNRECRALQKLLQKAINQKNQTEIVRLSNMLKYKMDKLNNKIIV